MSILNKTQSPSTTEELLFEKSSSGRRGVLPPSHDIDKVNAYDLIPSEMLRKDFDALPELSELDTVRHYTRLSQLNLGVDTAFYPLGSCTMKYNPKVNEDIASLDGFLRLHPYQPDELNQGALRIIYEMEGMLKEITGMYAMTLHPAAGAQGELTGMLMLAAYFRDRGERRNKVIIPDSAHGTNPASCHLAGFSVVPLKTGVTGNITPEAVEAIMDNETAALMLTNPNTLGLYEDHIKAVADIVHKKGGLLYCDGANLNAIMGGTKLKDLGVDIVQLNLHKTFATPHGGGGPGSGPIGVNKDLSPYLPKPRIKEEGRRFIIDDDLPSSIGRLRAFHVNFSIVVRAYSYIRAMGGEGLKKASEMAILSANYILSSLKDYYDLPYSRTCMHECVFSDKEQLKNGVRTLDIAKRLIDYGFHPPTIYFPLIVPGAIMIEPTETESKETLDSFIEIMRNIARESRDTPDLVRKAPHTTKIERVDEARAVKKPLFRWQNRS